METQPKNAVCVVGPIVPHGDVVQCIETPAASGGVGRGIVQFGKRFCAALTFVLELHVRKSTVQNILRGTSPSVATNSNDNRHDGNYRSATLRIFL